MGTDSIVMLVLGGMHIFNLFVFSKLPKKGLHPTPPPVIAGPSAANAKLTTAG